MTQSTPERKKCSVCPGEYTVTANKVIRHHFTDNPDFQAGPDSRKCRGAGKPPEGAATEDQTADDPQCRLCRHPVQLTDNGRARTHLTPEAKPRNCPAGSDFPLGVYPDIIGTTDGLVATLAAECDHVPVGQCYDCYGAPVPAELVGDGDGTESKPEPAETITRTGTNDAVVAAAPTMADRLKAVETDDFGQPIRECFNCDVVGCTGCGEPAPADGRPQASRFTELLKQETRGAGTVLDRVPVGTYPNADSGAVADAVVKLGPAAGLHVTDYRTPERKAADARMSELTREAIKVLEQRTPEQKAETAARMDRTASRVLGLPLDPALNHQYTDPSGIVWDHDGPAETCQSPDCETWRRIHPDGAYCEKCDTDNHRCPGCGTGLPHGTVACTSCHREALAGRLPQGTTEDGRPCDHHEAVFGVENEQLVCVACGTPCTHPDGFKGTAEDFDEGGQDRVVSVCRLCGAMDPGDELPDDEPQTGPARLGDLDEGDLFTRNGTLMRLTERESGTSVLAEVLDGPHRGRIGELKNPDEVVERAEWFVNTAPREVDAAKAGDDWRTPADGLALMSEEIRGMDALRLNCAECGHPITPLIEQFSFDGRAAVVIWVCERARAAGALSCDNGGHECRPDCLVNIGDLEFGDHFVRRGVLMRATSSGYGLVEAVVVEGPMKGRTGELKNPAEQVERTYCRHEWVTEVPPNGLGHAGPGCEYCGALKTKEEETKECPDNRDETPARRRSSAATTRTTTSPTPAPAPGSKPPTKASAPAVSPKSQSVTSSAPTATAAGNGRSAVVTTDQSAAAQFLASGSKSGGDKDRYDGKGRYKVTHPDTGKPVTWTRATTFAKAISNTFALGKYDQRLVLLGATMRPDIRDRAHGKHVRVDKNLLDALATDLREAAGGGVAANKGTTVHGFTEAVDHAYHTPAGPMSVLDTVPREYQGIVVTYIMLLEQTGLEPIPYLTEFTTAVKQYQVAGTSDNCYKITKPLTVKTARGDVHLAPGEYVIGDKKSGRSLEFAQREIAIQLGTYAQGLNTSGRFDWDTRTWDPDPLGGAKVRTDVGLVVHLPVDDDATEQPSVQGVDTESGWNAAVLCERVRTWHKVKTLGPVVVEGADTFAPSRPAAPEVTTRTNVRPASLRDRAGAVTSKGEASAVWQQAKKDGLPDAEVDELVKTMQARLAEREEQAG